MNHLDNLKIGTVGWQRPEWDGAFYPEDMPAEWQFDYYSTLYGVVLIPEAEWLSWNDPILDELAESVSAGFYFYLAVNEMITPLKQDLLRQLQGRLGRAIAGLVVFSDECLPDLIIADLPVSLVSHTQCLPGWCWNYSDVKISGQPLAYLSHLPSDGKLQSAILREFMASLPSNCQGAPVFVGGTQIDMKQVANFKIVSEFLGY